MTTQADREAERILAEYQRRERDLDPEHYSLSRPGNLFIRQGQQRALRDALANAGAFPLANRRILEVGCGRGAWFPMFEGLGATRDQLAGIDLDAGRIAEARTRMPGSDLRHGDATRLPWPDASFDFVFQSTVFTSILDASLREAVAREMARVCKESGAILWYDFAYNNPRNPHVRGVGVRELRRLFPDWHVDYRRVTLAPPLARRLVPRSWFVASVLEHVRLLNTHLFAVIRVTSAT